MGVIHHLGPLQYCLGGCVLNSVASLQSVAAHLKVLKLVSTRAIAS